MKNTAIKNDLYLPFMRRYTQTAVSCIATINDKSFNSEKFRGLQGSSGMWGKVSRFFSVVAIRPALT